MKSTRDNVLTNLKQGESADIVIVVGPDGKNSSVQKETFEAIKQKCKSEGLKYFILGDGIQPITSNELTILPRSENVIIVCHGSVKRQNTGEAKHSIKLSNADTPDFSVDVMKKIQEQTGAKNLVVDSCFAGRIHEDFKSGVNLVEGSQLITTSAKDETANSLIGDKVAEQFITAIKRNQHKPISLSDQFGHLLNEIPETINFGTQTQMGFLSFTARRDDRVHGNADTKRFVASSIDKFNQFLNNVGVKQVKVPGMSDKQVNHYEVLRIQDHLKRGDANFLIELIKKDKNRLTAFNPVQTLLRVYPKNEGGDIKYRDTLAVLLKRYPKEISAYLNDPTMHATNDMNKNRSANILRDMLDIANQVDMKSFRSSLLEGLVKKQSPVNVLRVAIESGLTTVATDLIHAVKISDATIHGKLKESGLNLAFASDKAKSDPAIVLEAFKNDKLSLIYASNESTDALLKERKIFPDDLLAAKYQKNSKELEQAISQLNSPSPTPLERSSLMTGIKQLSQDLNNTKAAMSPFQQARTEYYEVEKEYQKSLLDISKSKADQPQFMKMVEHARMLEQKVAILKENVITAAKQAPIKNPQIASGRENERMQCQRLQEKNKVYTGSVQVEQQKVKVGNKPLASENTTEAQSENTSPRLRR